MHVSPTIAVTAFVDTRPHLASNVSIPGAGAALQNLVTIVYHHTGFPTVAMPSTRGSKKELLTRATAQMAREKDEIDQAKLPFNAALFKAKVREIGWTNDDVLEWITGPALPHLKE